MNKKKCNEECVQVVEKLLREGYADLVSMARPFLADHNFVLKSMENRGLFLRIFSHIYFSIYRSFLLLSCIPFSGRDIMIWMWVWIADGDGPSNAT